MVVVNDVRQLQFKFYQNRTRLRGVNTCFLVIGTSKKVFFGPSRHHYQSNYDILLKTVEQTWLTIKKLCDFQVMGGVEESEARNYLPNEEKSQFFVIFTNLAVFIIFFKKQEMLNKS